MNSRSTAGDLAALASAMSPAPDEKTSGAVTPPNQAKPARGGRGRSSPAIGGPQTLPDEPLSPGANCRPDEVKFWAAKLFDRMEKSIQGVQHLQNKQSQQIKALEEFEPKHRSAMMTLDLKLEAIYKEKNDSKKEMVDLKHEVGQITSIIHKNTKDAAMDLHNLRGELSDFAGNIAQNAEHLKTMEAKFKDHVEQNFRVVEKECGDIRRALSASGAATSSPVGAAVSTLEFNIAKNKIEAHEKAVL